MLGAVDSSKSHCPRPRGKADSDQVIILSAHFKTNLSRLVGKPTMWFPNRFDTNRAVQAQKLARSLKFWIESRENQQSAYAKTKALISFAVTAKLICVFVFAYADCWFSHEAAHLFLNIKGHVGRSSPIHKTSTQQWHVMTSHMC